MLISRQAREAKHLFTQVHLAGWLQLMLQLLRFWGPDYDTGAKATPVVITYSFDGANFLHPHLLKPHGK